MSTRRRRIVPWWLLVAAFVVVPLVEIYVLIQVGQVIGAWWTILLLVVDSLVGAWLVKREGARAWRALRDALAGGRMPHRELADGVLILVGGTLMLTPGFVTDLAGILCILPLTRPVGRRMLSGLISRKLIGSPLVQTPRTQRRPGPVPDDGVVRGEVVDEGPEPPR